MGLHVRKAPGQARSATLLEEDARIEESIGQPRADRDGSDRGVSSRHHGVGRAAIAFAGLLLLSCQTGDTSTSPTSTAGLREGQLAPSFELPSAGGGNVRLSDYRGEKQVLLYFSMGPG